MILAPKPAAWLLLPGSGAFGLETFWLGSATSGSLRDSNDDGATTKVGLAVSEPNEARRRAKREFRTSAVRMGRYRQACGTRRDARLRRVPIRVRDLSSVDRMMRADARRSARWSRRSQRSWRSRLARRRPLHTTCDVPNHGAHGANHDGHGASHGDQSTDHGGHCARHGDHGVGHG